MLPTLSQFGLPGLLTALACEGGRNPFNGNLHAAHASRRGNVGPDGRCGSILDVYEVPCTEQTYDVYADMFFCSERTASDWM